MAGKRKKSCNKPSQNKKVAKKEEAKISRPQSICILFTNPGYSHMAQKIFGYLDHKSQLLSRLVCQSWKAQIDQPHFWIKKCDQLGQEFFKSWKAQNRIPISESWIDVANGLEKGSVAERGLVKLLMKEFVDVKKKIRDHLEKLDMHMYQVHFEKKYNLVHKSKFPFPPVLDFLCPFEGGCDFVGKNSLYTNVHYMSEHNIFKNYYLEELRQRNMLLELHPASSKKMCALCPGVEEPPPEGKGGKIFENLI